MAHHEFIPTHYHTTIGWHEPVLAIASGDSVSTTTVCAGRTWEHVTAGFPDAVSHNIDTFHLGFSPCGRAWAAVDKALYTSHDRGNSWESAWRAPDKIRMIA